MTKLRLLPRLALAAALAMAASVSVAATTMTPATGPGWVMKRDSTVFGSPFSSEDACWQGARDHAEAARKSGNYTCAPPKSARITYTDSPPPPPPVCGASPATTQSQSCPANTTGTTWTQSRTATAAAYPTCWTLGAWTPTTAPASQCPPVVTQPPASATYYFSDCQAGAAAGCVAGSNTNDGLSASTPKQTLAGVNVNALPAGARLLFNRGGAWANFSVTLQNPNATPLSPLVFDAYGAGEAPVFRTPSGNAFSMGGRWGNTDNDGGYTLRNLKLDGQGTADWGVWLVQNVRNVVLENVDISGFLIGVHSSSGAPYNVTGLVLRNSKIHLNRSMGMLGEHHGGVVEGNTFEANNFSGSDRNHGIYYSGGNGTTIRNNVFLNNSVVNGTCLGGQLTAHGQIDGLLIEGNSIQVPVGEATCYGISVTTGYDTVEAFRNVVIRGNTIVNVGRAAIAVNSAPAVLIENNRVRMTGTVQQYGVWLPANGGSNPQDEPDRDGIVRNNLFCTLSTTSGHVSVSSTAPGSVTSGNVTRTGADSSTGVCAF